MQFRVLYPLILGCMLLFSTPLGDHSSPFSWFALDNLSAQERLEWSQPKMGVTFNIVIYSDDVDGAKRAAEQAFERIDELNLILSDYQANSEIRLLCRNTPHEKAVPVSEELFDLLQKSQAISHASGGAFDVTVGPLTRLWRISRRNRRLPAPDQLEIALAATDYQAIELTTASNEKAAPPSVKLLKAGMRLDAGGIGKGYAADEAYRILVERGFPVSFVDASGDLVLGDPPPGKLGWDVGVAPLEADGTASRLLSLSNCAIATSGDAFQFIEIDGQRYSHIVDPKTGLGLTTRSSVTIIAPTGALADGWASAVSVLGPVKGTALIDRIDSLESLIVTMPKSYRMGSNSLRNEQKQDDSNGDSSSTPRVRPIVTSSKNFPAGTEQESSR